MAVLDYLLKLKRNLGLDFGAHFLHEFSIKMYSINRQGFNVVPFFLNEFLLEIYFPILSCECIYNIYIYIYIEQLERGITSKNTNFPDLF